jgi:histone H2A
MPRIAKKPVEETPAQDVPAVEAEKKKKKKSVAANFSPAYTMKVKKEVCPEYNISGKAVRVIGDLAADFTQQLIKEENTLLSFNKKSQNQTVLGRHANSAFKLRATGEISKHGESEAVKAIKEYKNFEKTDDKSTTWAKKCGLRVSPAWVRKVTKKSTSAKRISKENCIAKAAYVEYMIAEILELASNAAGKKTKTMKPKHIQAAIMNDEELHKMFANAQVSKGGFKSNIHPNLMKLNMPRS